MREPAKWLALVQLGYVIGFAAGVQALQSSARVPAALRRPLPVVAMLLPLAVLPALAWGLGGRVSTTDYPDQLGCRGRAARPGAGPAAVPALARLPAVPLHRRTARWRPRPRALLPRPGPVEQRRRGGATPLGLHVEAAGGHGRARRRRRGARLRRHRSPTSVSPTSPSPAVSRTTATRGWREQPGSPGPRRPDLRRSTGSTCRSRAWTALDVRRAGAVHRRARGPGHGHRPRRVLDRLAAGRRGPARATPEGTIAFEVGAERAADRLPHRGRASGSASSSVSRRSCVILVAGLVEHRADLRPRAQRDATGRTLDA